MNALKLIKVAALLASEHADASPNTLSIVTAGFIGGVLSLSLVKDLTPFKALMTVMAGTATAYYMTPIIAAYLDKDGAHSNHYAVAFILGVCGMNALAGVFKISESFASAPIETLKARGKIKSTKTDKEKE